MGRKIRGGYSAGKDCGVIYKKLALADVVLIVPQPARDERGYFVRLLDRAEMREHGLQTEYTQESLAFNALRGTLRGLHYQTGQYAETKLIRCTKGKIFDVVVDVRPTSPTYGRWISLTLDASEHGTLYVPKGFAHGYQTLVPEAEVAYKITPDYEASTAAGIHYADPTLNIPWPLPNPIVSDRDRGLPRFV